MEREEAISEWTFRSTYIKKWLDKYGEEPSIRHYVELIDMAIEALSQPIVVKCYEIDNDRVYCSPEMADKIYRALHEKTNVQNMHRGENNE